MPRFRGKTAVQFEVPPEVTRALARDGEVWQRVQKAVIRGMTENTEDLLGRAMRDAPVDEGTLRASGTAAIYANRKLVSRTRGIGVTEEGEVAVSERQEVAEGGLGDAVMGEVGFNAPYARAQHERLDFHHPKGGKAKYLEDNLKTQSDRYQGNLQDHIRGALE